MGSAQGWASLHGWKGVSANDTPPVVLSPPSSLGAQRKRSGKAEKSALNANSEARKKAISVEARVGNRRGPLDIAGVDLVSSR